jgi:hypothetical protein
MTNIQFESGRELGYSGELYNLPAYGWAFFLNFGATILCSFACSILLTTLTYTLMTIYNKREERLTNIAFADLKPELPKRLKRCLRMILFELAVVILTGTMILLLGMASAYTLIVTVPLFIAGMIPLFLFAPVYLFEDAGIVRAFVKAFRLGVATMRGVLGVFVITEAVVLILNSAASIPWLVAVVVRYVFFMSDTPNEMTLSAGYGIVQYVFALIMTFGACLFSIFPLVGLAYQYAHAREKTVTTTVQTSE